MRENEKHLLRKGLLISCCSCCSCCFNQIFWGARSALWICCCSWAFLQCAFAYNFHLLILMRGRKGRLSWSCCCFNQNLVGGHFTCNWHFLILMGEWKSFIEKRSALLILSPKLALLILWLLLHWQDMFWPDRPTNWGLFTNVWTIVKDWIDKNLILILVEFINC